MNVSAVRSDVVGDAPVSWESYQRRTWAMEPTLVASDMPGSWDAVLEGRQANEIFALNADPLRALHEGHVPAVVLRQHLAPDEAARLAALVKRSLTSSQAKRSSRRRGGSGPNLDGWKKRGGTLHTLGADLHYSLKRRAHFSSLMSYLSYAKHYAGLVDDFGLAPAVQALHTGLHSLSAGRRVGVMTDPVTNLSYSPGVFKVHSPGNTFPLHFDSLWSLMWNRRACGTGGWRRRNATHRALSAGTNALRLASFTADALRFRYQFSALLMLQQPEGGGPDVTLFDSHWEDLIGDCELSGLSHTVGVHVQGYDTSQRRRHARTYNLSLQPGDLYIFNSNRLHVVPPVGAGRERIVLGSFLGYSATELRSFA
jgi:hypothetical protein